MKSEVSTTNRSGSDESLDLVRERIGVFAASFTLLSVTASLACPIVAVALLGSTWSAQLSHPGNIAGALAPIPLAVVWAICRFTRPSPRVLDALDFVGTFTFCLGWTMMSYFAPSASHPALDVQAPLASNPPIGVFANMAVLYLRAAVIPGTPRRTLVVSSISSIPIVCVAWLISASQESLTATSFALGTTLLTLWTVPGPAIVTWVIYSLRKQIRQTKQLGQYTLEAKIGEGGMGVVYRAKHALLRRQTAIKLLPPDRASGSDIARFEREVQETSRLTHPNTIAIYDYGHTADGVFYYAMEYLDGLSLEDLVGHDGPQPPGRVVSIVRQACGALAEAHARGLIHRDIKPANLHISVRGGVPDHVKVLDFGLVKEIGRGRQEESARASLTDNASSTQQGFVGTPLYMAPESITQAAPVDARTDLYALGAVAYFLLTGTPPFRAQSVIEVFAMHLHHVPEAPSQRLGKELPRELDALVLACLAKAPAERPASATELGQALASASSGSTWKDADALHWWKTRGPTLRKLAEKAPGLATPGANTVAVDLEGRS